MRFALPAALVCCLVASVGLGQDWARAMFDHTFHDFGVVPRGANVEHRFRIKNIYREDVHIQSVRSTCGCTVPRITRQWLKTNETAEIVAALDTRRFTDRKDATLTVTFDQPFPAEVQLRVTCFIRHDVIFEPGAVQFGTVVQGTRTPVRLSVSQTGRHDWAIVDVQSHNRHLEARLQEVGRNLGQVTYELWVFLKEDAPVGYLKDYVVVVTNDLNPQTARILLAVEGVVIPPPTAVTAAPSTLHLGVLCTGRSVSRTLVVRGGAPFRILEVAGPDSRFRFEWAQDAKPLHVICAIVSSGDTPGHLAGTIRIRTDAPGYQLLEVAVDGQVVGPEPTTTSTKPSGAP